MFSYETGRLISLLELFALTEKIDAIAQAHDEPSSLPHIWAGLNLYIPTGYLHDTRVAYIYSTYKITILWNYN